jgi:hypothetical protein
MEIDENAPVWVRAETYIAATPAEVWDVLTDFARWPEWNPDVKDVRADGPVAPGTEFSWRAGRASITSTIHEAREPHEIGWTGRTSGITARHVWRLEAEGTMTRVITAESWAGLAPRLFRARLTRTLERALEKGLSYLDAEFGRRSIAAMAQAMEEAEAAPGSAAAA